MRALLVSLVLLGLISPFAAAFDLDERLQFADGLYTRGMYELAGREYTAILEAAPGAENVDRILFRRGECYRHMGDRVAADKDFRRVFSEFPKSDFRFRAGYRRADLYLDADQYGAAIDLYGAVLAASPPAEIGAACTYFLGEAQFRQGDTQAAVATFEKLRKDYPNSAFDGFALLKLGSIHLKNLEDQDAALSYFTKATDEVYSGRIRAEALFQIAEIHFAAQAFEQSSDMYAELIAKYPDDPRAAQARLKAGWAALYSGRYAEALRYVNTALSDPNTGDGAEWYYLKANCERQLVRNEEAVKTYLGMIERYPNSDFAPPARYELALTYYKMGNFEDAIKAASRVDVSGPLAEDVYWLLAECHSAVGREDDAIQYYRLLTSKFPEGKLAGEASYRLAHLLQARGENLEASRYFLKTASDFPDSDIAPQALFASAFCLQKQNLHEEAARDWSLLIERYPSHPLVEEAMYQKAMSALRMERREDAAETFRMLMEKFPKTRFLSDAHYWRGMVLKQLGRLEDAESELRAALRASPRADLEREVQLGLALVLLEQNKADDGAKLLVALVHSPVREKFTPALLQWLAEHELERGQHGTGITIARMLVDMNASPAWTQTGWALIGRGCLIAGKTSDAVDAFTQAMATGADTPFAAEAALRLGDLAEADGRHEDASAHFQRAASLARSDSQLGIRAHAYAGLARAAIHAGNAAEAARYFMSVAILYNDAQLVPECLAGAAEAFRSLGQNDQAEEALQELKTRYPDSPQARELAGDKPAGGDDGKL